MSANITKEEKRAALDRALSSYSVADHPQLRDFLEFTGDRVIRGDAATLTEAAIAKEVLGQPPDFDPRLDPLVRSCARRVRRKLAVYYKTDGAADPVWVTIPHGQYLPDFVWRKRNVRGMLPAIFIGGLIVGIIALAWVLFQILPMQRAQESGAGESSEPVNVILSPFLHGSHRTTLAVFDLPLAEDAHGNLLRLKDGSADTAATVASEELKRLLVDPDLARSGSLFPATGYTGTGEALSAALFGRCLASRPNGFDVRTWSSLSQREREGSNMLLVGPVDMGAVALGRGSISDFRFVRTQQASGRRLLAIENLRPASGERTLYEARNADASSEPEEVYALISFLPGRAPGTHWLVIAGSTGTGTLGASEYVVNGRILRDLPPGWTAVGGQPPAFEMLVRVRVRDGHPLNAEYVLHHVHYR